MIDNICMRDDIFKHIRESAKILNKSKDMNDNTSNDIINNAKINGKKISDMDMFNLEFSVYSGTKIDFEVKKGETVGIIGTNGSGKSTLLKIITGVLTPTSGEVHVDGRISALLELGAGFNQEYNGIENIYLNGTMMGFSEKEIEAKLPSILEFADIGDYVYQPVKTYSSGMYSKLSFAITAILETDIILIDEVLSVGDARFRKKSYAKMKELINQNDRTVVIVSHDNKTLLDLCDKLLWINDGEVMQFGETKEVLSAYEKYVG